jgi:hypothetical protein
VITSSHRSGFRHRQEGDEHGQAVQGEEDEDARPAEAQQRSADRRRRQGGAEHDKHHHGKALGRFHGLVGITHHGHADHRGEAAANGLQRPQPEDDFYGFGQGDEHGRGREDD